MDLTALLESSGAILKGHFLLSSGRHSDVYFEKFRILERPDVLSALCAEIANHYRNSGIDVVAGPTTGGIIIAFEVARQLGVAAIYVESVDGQKTIRRGGRVPAGSKVLVVDDVLTTGLSVQETVNVLEKAGGHVAGVAVLIDRSTIELDFGAPLMSAYRVDAKSYLENELPEWLEKIPVTQPGTRTF